MVSLVDLFEWSIDIIFCCGQAKMSLQLYQVDAKSYLLDFKSLDTVDHPDAAKVKRMTRASMSSSTDAGELMSRLLNLVNTVDEEGAI